MPNSGRSWTAMYSAASATSSAAYALAREEFVAFGRTRKES